MQANLPTLGEIEAGFIARRHAPPALAASFLDALETASGRPLPRMSRAVRAIADAADAWPGPEPAYHNRHHFAEAAISMGWLAGLAVRQGLLSPPHAALGVVAMAGHDLLHDGSTPGPGVLERQSLAAVSPMIAAAGLDPEEQDLVAAAILATAPARMPGNMAALAAAGPAPGPATVLCALANEADLFASILPRLGLRLARLLAEEWRHVPGRAPCAVGSHAGQIAFLAGIPAFSAPAQAAGLHRARQACFAAFASFGPTAQEGAARLDAMELWQAEAAYEAAAAAILRSV